MNHVLEDWAICVYFTCSSRQWDVLRSDNGEGKPSRYTDAHFYLETKLSSGIPKTQISSMLLNIFT